MIIACEPRHEHKKIMEKDSYHICFIPSKKECQNARVGIKDVIQFFDKYDDDKYDKMLNDCQDTIEAAYTIMSNAAIRKRYKRVEKKRNETREKFIKIKTFLKKNDDEETNNEDETNDEDEDETNDKDKTTT